MKIHVFCTSSDESCTPNDEERRIVKEKVAALGHEIVDYAGDADCVLVVVTMNNFRFAMNWIPVLWDGHPTTPIIFMESDYPNRIFGSLEVECEPDQLQQALKSMVMK